MRCRLLYRNFTNQRCYEEAIGHGRMQVAMIAEVIQEAYDTKGKQVFQPRKRRYPWLINGPESTARNKMLIHEATKEHREKYGFPVKPGMTEGGTEN